MGLGDVLSAIFDGGYPQSDSVFFLCSQMGGGIVRINTPVGAHMACFQTLELGNYMLSTRQGGKSEIMRGPVFLANHPELLKAPLPVLFFTSRTLVDSFLTNPKDFSYGKILKTLQITPAKNRHAA